MKKSFYGQVEPNDRLLQLYLTESHDILKGWR